MALFAVKYQLNETKNYKPLWDEMDRLCAHKVLRSFYFLDLSDITAAELRNHLMDFIDSDDAVVVIPMLARPHPHKAFKGTNDWINARFS